MQFLLLLLLSFSSAYSNKGQEELQRNLYITDNYHQNVVSIRTRKHIRHWGDNHFCAGSLLSAWWVVTSSCCVSTVPESTPNKSNSRKNLRVVVFTPRRLKKPSPKDVFHIQKIVLEENPLGECSQLALLKLDRGVTGQRLAMMLPDKELNSTWLCSSLGWGRIYYDGPYSSELLQIRTQKISSYSCKPACNSCLCMGSYTGRGNMCQQDLGSPLYCDRFLYGVARRVQSCEAEGFMVYTNIYRKRKFIEDTLSGTHSQKNSYAFVYFLVELALASFLVVSSAWTC
ncbi:kallikrein 1-related peptidase b8 [Drosophila yakuba]|uniref:kallikrein 1-related peptidase b8 n=1 Tax=Drosophila yakuba TaxID=7245 RepID=UPI0019308020|nr:kallikrein 1-related peptidase b8 [Drosophila yakuba]